MDIREKMIEIFEDTEKWYSTDTELKESVLKTINGTKLYKENDYLEYDKCCDETSFELVKARSFETAVRLSEEYPKKRIGVHNFASATNPGGGVRKGSRAQEEALCRCSTLMPALSTDELMEKYYQFHRDRHNTLYTDACIYTPDVKIIKSDTDLPERLSRDKWITVDVLTCAAPNLRCIKLTDNELLEAHNKRARHLFAVAAANNIKILVLGAFGCGAFQNNPAIVAKAYRTVIDEFDGVFERIAFAIYCTPRESRNYDAFLKVFSE